MGEEMEGMEEMEELEEDLRLVLLKELTLKLVLETIHPPRQHKEVIVHRQVIVRLREGPHLPVALSPTRKVTQKKWENPAPLRPEISRWPSLRQRQWLFRYSYNHKQYIMVDTCISSLAFLMQRSTTISNDSRLKLQVPTCLRKCDSLPFLDP